MSKAKLTQEQWAGFGRLQRILTERLDVPWSMAIHYFEYRTGPLVEANVPGYENSGFGHAPEPINGAISRDIDFTTAQNAA